ncbi:hypothetical protein TIFTF001_024000 [Ficus carica]|uniref:UBZ4-type domain-containing protein n=1 Tax=Ficus carica TaxID=3494 RepID=A0AA88DEB9_FICCA|nr:hypothetical protein TIFTF001_024000 [Ficus carica]
MAVAFEGFSIREYTAKMRSVDVAKCWPFPEEMMKIRRRREKEGQQGGDAAAAEEEEEEALLPPMSVVKFKWWSHELRRLRSESTSEDDKSEPEMVCPVCRVFAASTVNAVNAHIDDCLVADQAAKADRRIVMRSKAAKAKSKPPKKRSITEIFAVAPQIDAIEDASEASEREEEEDDEDEDEDGEAENHDKLLVDNFKVLSVSSRCSGPTIKKSKTVIKSKKRKKEKKEMVMMDEDKSLRVLHKMRENNTKLRKKKKKVKKKKAVDGSIATKIIEGVVVVVVVLFFPPPPPVLQLFCTDWGRKGLL